MLEADITYVGSLLSRAVAEQLLHANFLVEDNVQRPTPNTELPYQSSSIQPKGGKSPRGVPTCTDALLGRRSAFPAALGILLC
jgi:hypothetical protein